MKTKKIICNPLTFGGKAVPKSAYFEYREALRKRVTRELIRIEKGDVDLRIKLYLNKDKIEKSDLDNYLKAIIDGISDFHNEYITKEQGKGIITENQIKSIYIERELDKNEGLEIEIIPNPQKI